MKVLITGSSGFVAYYLALELIHHQHQVILTAQEDGEMTIQNTTYPILGINLCDRAEVKKGLAHLEFDAVVHLAGISHLIDAETDRKALAEVNIMGTNHLCCAIVERKIPCTFLLASSTVVFGHLLPPTKIFDENSPTNPINPYGFSKLAAEAVVRCFDSSSFKTYIARPSNHIGMGQAPHFVCPSLARKIALAPPGSAIEVGNLQSERDFCDVRDIARAYRLILEKQPDESIFVLGQGQTISIREILTILIDLSGKNLHYKEVLNLKRSGEAEKIAINPSRAKIALGWECQIPIKDSLKNILEDAFGGTYA